MAGYLFQPDRALLLLSENTGDFSVCIEVVDDLSVMDSTGKVIIREQDKHTIREDGKPIADRSKDLWNTLFIWVKAAEAGEIDTKSVRLICSTNVEITADLLIQKISDANTAAKAKKLVEELEKAIKNPPETIKEQVEYVLTRKSILTAIIPCIMLIDNNSVSNLDNTIAEKLRLLPEKAQEIITHLKGWVHESIRLCWQEGKPAVITSASFRKIYNHLMYSFHENQIRIRVKEIVLKEIPGEEKESSKGRRFVRQLEKMAHPELEDIILEAIDEFLCSENERLRLVLDGNILEEEMEKMDNSNFDRWKQMFRRHISDGTSGMSEEELAKLAYKIYDATISGYNALLAKEPVDTYLTNGSFYRMSDEPKIGWHPNWEELFKEK